MDITIEQRDATVDAARTTEDRADCKPGEKWLARCLVAERSEVLLLRAEVIRLQDACERTARVGHDNATNYAAELAAERQAGAARVERIRAAIAEGATDAEQARALAWAVDAAFDDGARHSLSVRRDAAAFLALADDLRATRANLSTIDAALRRFVAEHFGAKP
jgi:hypothetical protein